MRLKLFGCLITSFLDVVAVWVSDLRRGLGLGLVP